MRTSWARLTLAAVAAAFPAERGMAEDRERRVLVVVAHPDNELFFAPALAMEARQGARVSIAYATQGEAGPGVSGMEKGAKLGRTRLAEALCASGALGLDMPMFFDFGDGRLTDRPQDANSAALRLKQALERALSAERPDLVITWGPDGGYSNGDHRMVSAIVSQVVQAMPAGLRPELLYPGIPTGNVPDMPELRGWAETDAALLTERYTYNRDDLARAVAATQCHKTQFDDAQRAGLVPLFDQAIWRGVVGFRKGL
ncbi:PIG-L family deacetylase [Parerythrobacter aurantius]|uniref:PIG-L deacetylase family protein n=1 Tax=Parerythrobacter aurantius TaxID=3127706 RepID=UPI00324D492C